MCVEWVSASTSIASLRLCMQVAVGEEAVERLGEAIGAEHLLRGLSPMISEALATPARADGSEWCAHFAGLSALSETSDMLPDDDASTHETLLRQVAPFVSSRHPRVRHAALGTLSSLCLHNDPIFQLHTHAALVPLIVAGLKDATSRRVRAQVRYRVAIKACPARTDWTAYSHAGFDPAFELRWHIAC